MVTYILNLFMLIFQLVTSISEESLCSPKNEVSEKMCKEQIDTCSYMSIPLKFVPEDDNNCDDAPLNSLSRIGTCMCLSECSVYRCKSSCEIAQCRWSNNKCLNPNNRIRRNLSNSNSSQCPIEVMDFPPTCIPPYADVLWIIDGSSSMFNDLETWRGLLRFLSNFSRRFLMGKDFLRQAIVEFSGPTYNKQITSTIGAVLNFSDDAAQDGIKYREYLSKLLPRGGTTDITSAIEFATQVWNTTDRTDTKRITFLVTRGGPTSIFGISSMKGIRSSQQAAKTLKEKTGSVFSFIQYFDPTIGYPNEYMVGVADPIYPEISEITVWELLESFTCDSMM